MALFSRLKELFGFGSKRPNENVERFGGLQAQDFNIPIGEELTQLDFNRKFISGLFYCGGNKRQFYALTFEQNDTDREDELLQVLEATFTNCSDMREDHGYSTDRVDKSEVSAIFPDVETGEL